MQQHFMRRIDAERFFNKPRRPLPPLFSRSRGSERAPSCLSPVGAICDNDLVELTAEQYRIWRTT